MKFDENEVGDSARYTIDEGKQLYNETKTWSGMKQCRTKATNQMNDEL